MQWQHGLDDPLVRGSIPNMPGQFIDNQENRKGEPDLLFQFPTDPIPAQNNAQGYDHYK